MTTELLRRRIALFEWGIFLMAGIDCLVGCYGYGCHYKQFNCLVTRRVFTFYYKVEFHSWRNNTVVNGNLARNTKLNNLLGNIFFKQTNKKIQLTGRKNQS